MSTVATLIPGDRIALPGRKLTFVARAAHPLYPGFQLVVWWSSSEEWFHDALMMDQYVGELVQELLPAEARVRNLKAALRGNR